MAVASLGNPADDEKLKKGNCPVCEMQLTFQEGCMQCHSCGWGGCDV